MRQRLAMALACALPAIALLATSPPVVAQQTDIGIAPVILGEGPYFFPTAQQERIRVDVLARGLVHPFSLAFLPNGDALITERGARLRLVRNAAREAETAVLVPQAIEGAPVPANSRAGGLTEIAVHPDFANNQTVFFTYNRVGLIDPKADPPARSLSTLILAQARFDGVRLLDAKEILVGEGRPVATGSRLAFGPNGTLFIATGAASRPDAGNLDNIHGKVLRVNTDGSIPQDNPFTSRKGVRPEIYSFGHRDQAGLIVHPVTGALLSAEYGPNGGDEVNVILPGRNYGWPVYSFGRTYEGPRFSAVPLGEDTEQPLVLWLPSIAPSGMTLYTASRFPAWTGNLFVGSLRRGGIPRTGSLERIVFNDKLEELRRESLLSELHQRIRDVRQGPDGLLYVLTDEEDGALLRISPAP